MLTTSYLADNNLPSLSCVPGLLQESWNPMWTVSSILTGLLSFMVEDQITTGSLKTTVSTLLLP